VAPLGNPHVQELAARHGAQVVADPGSAAGLHLRELAW
jgi:hypothetical protein